MIHMTQRFMNMKMKGAKSISAVNNEIFGDIKNRFSLQFDIKF